MKSRRALIVIILLVIGGGVGGLSWYLKRSSATTMLERAELALEARKYDKALGLAQNYSSKNTHWRGHLVAGKAMTMLGQFQEARLELQKARQLSDNENVFLALADTYIVEARQRVNAEKMPDQDSITETIELFMQAQNMLGQCPQPMPMTVQEYMGLNCISIGRMLKVRSDNFRKASDIAATASAHKASQEAAQQSKAAMEESRQSFAKAIEHLAQVIASEPSRQQAANALVETCLHLNDRNHLLQAKAAILALPHPPALAATRLIVEDLPTFQTPMMPEDRRQIEAAITAIKALVETGDSKHNKPSWDEMVSIKVLLGELAMRLDRLDEVERLTYEIFQGDSRQPQAQLMRAKLYIKQEKLEQAEQELYSLKSSYSSWAEAHFVYGLVVNSLKKPNLAEQAMRMVTVLDPTHAQARQFLIQSMLRQNSAKEAFLDAKELYQAHDDDPIALRLLVQVACEMNRPELAKEPLDQSVMKYPDQPCLMIEAVEGYQALTNQGQVGENQTIANNLAKKIAACKPRSPQERFAVAKAMQIIGQTSNAEAMLNSVVTDFANWAPAHYQLAEFYSQLGRKLQAMEYYRQAVALDKSNPAYHFSLARALLEVGDLEQSHQQAQQLADNDHPMASLLSAQIDLLRGGNLDLQQVLKNAPDRRMAGFWLAYTGLSSGNPQKCLEVVNAALAEDPTDGDMLLLGGQAHLAMGDVNSCIACWQSLLKLQPDRLANYLRLAKPMWQQIAGKSPQAQPQELATQLVELGGRSELAQMAVGQALINMNDPQAAADVYGKIAASSLRRDLRQQATLLQAQSLVRANQYDQALEAIETLLAEPFWKPTALYIKAQVLMAQDKKDAAVAAMEDLIEPAMQQADFDALARILELHLKLKPAAAAVALCDRILAANPSDARAFLLKAQLLLNIDQGPQADEMLQKAISLQRGNFRLYVMRVRALDKQHMPQQALNVLEEMAAQGPSGQAAAAMERGRLLASWGLKSHAVKAYQQAQPACSINPTLRLDLARIYMQLGRPDEAGKLLVDVPEYASTQHRSAKLLLCLLETNPQRQLEKIRQLRATMRGDLELIGQEMSMLLGMNQAAAAAEVYVDSQVQDDSLAQLALLAMVQSGQVPAAAELASKEAARSSTALWRARAMILTAQASPEKAMALCPPPENAGPLEVALAMTLTQGQTMEPWRARLAQLNEQQKIAPSLAMLLALVAGDLQQAQTNLEQLKPYGPLVYQPAQEMLAWCKSTDSYRPGAIAMTHAQVAMDVGFGMLSRQWAMQVLVARTRCQWAASIAMNGADIATQKKVLEMLQPASCALACTITSSLHMQERQYGKALDQAKAALAAAPDSPELVLKVAQAYERCNQPQEALKIYTELFEKTSWPLAGNNAAYLVAQLYPQDAQRLAQAQSWMQKAIAKEPNNNALFDTSGWIAHLQGQHEQACKQLHRAIKVCQDSPEVHYHLGAAYKAAGKTALAQMHLQAAVQLGSQIKAAGHALPAATANAINMAQQALDLAGSKT